jgi:gamma-glutamyl-gamma-aminobutyrate hydrolase PuuD
LSVGICRGGQALNVFNGGKMYQHVSGHAGTDHKVFDALFDPGSEITVNSSHHQMMIPTAEGEILAYSEGVSSEYWGDEVNPLVKPQFETEVVWYDKTQSLCVQFHPEWGARGRADQPHECQEYFFNLVDMVR